MLLCFFNTVVSWFIPSKQLIGYEYKEGIPEHARTIVVVPTLITSRNYIDEQVHNLEVHYLSNPKGAIHFALLTDWVDAPFEQTQDDLDLLHYAQKVSMNSIAVITVIISPSFSFYTAGASITLAKNAGWDGNANVVSFMNSICY